MADLASTRRRKPWCVTIEPTDQPEACQPGLTPSSMRSTCDGVLKPCTVPQPSTHSLMFRRAIMWFLSGRPGADRVRVRLRALESVLDEERCTHRPLTGERQAAGLHQAFH